MSAGALDLARALIRCPSVTPADEGALAVLEAALEPLGFACERMPFSTPGTPDVDNLYARRGSEGPLFCFAGHTDVVPVGEPADWSVPPFSATVAGGRLTGRGAVDMKGAIAAFVTAVSRLGPVPGSIALLITGDEEGPAVNGTRPMLERLAARGERIDACVVGEPTNPARFGEMMKIGRRGSLNARLVVEGVQGHAAYPDLADNPVHPLLAMAHGLASTALDDGTAHFQPSSLQVTSVDVGNPTTNLIPARAEARFNIRFNDLHTGVGLEERLRRALDRQGHAYRLEVSVSGESFLTPPGPLVDLAAKAMQEVTGRSPALSTSGGTSDARFIKDYCPVVELGLVSETAHKVDEYLEIEDLEKLTRVYERMLAGYFLT